MSRCVAMLNSNFTPEQSSTFDNIWKALNRGDREGAKAYLESLGVDLFKLLARCPHWIPTLVKDGVLDVVTVKNSNYWRYGCGKSKALQNALFLESYQTIVWLVLNMAITVEDAPRGRLI